MSGILLLELEIMLQLKKEQGTSSLIVRENIVYTYPKFSISSIFRKSAEHGKKSLRFSNI